MVRDVFREKLSLMNLQDKTTIFHLWDELIVLHSDILFGLKTPKNDDIGKVFLKQKTKITHHYSSYCVHLPMAMSHLEHVVESNAQLKRQVQECQTQARPPEFPLSHFLVIPFQRFLKYHLLLQEILKRTPDDHPDLLNLKLGKQDI